MQSYTSSHNHLMYSIDSEQLFTSFMANDSQRGTLQLQLNTTLKSTQIINNKSLYSQMVVLSGFSLTRANTSHLLVI